MSDAVKIIAIIGMPGAGKSLVADFFRKKGMPVLRFGDQTDIGLKELGLPLSEKNERWYREKLRSELGMAAMAIKIEPRIIETAKQHQGICLDGLRSWEEYVYLIKPFPQLKIVCVYAPPAVRHRRLMSRAVRPLSKEEAHSRDIAEIENLHSAGPIAVADYLIKNESNNPEDITLALEECYKTMV